MEEQEPVDWNLLQHNPQAFFGLPISFDRKDLKRAYNVWLKRFKPEQYPTEFQRIRAAYELLESQLRFQRNQELPPEDSIRPTLSDTDPVSLPDNSGHSQEKQSPVEPVAFVRELLARKDREGAVLELSQKEQKTSFEYYALAVLSDFTQSCAEEDSTGFVDWILAGLETHRGDPSLLQLLRAYLREASMNKRDMKRILERIVTIFPNDWFYYLSEPLWLRFVHEVDWSTFVETLQQCDRMIRDPRQYGRLAFKTRLLRAALFRAPDDWCKETLDELEENSQSMNSSLLPEFEIVAGLLTLKQRAERFLSKGPMSQRIFDSMRSYCEDSEEVWQKKIIASQAILAANPSAVLSEFQYTDIEAKDLVLPWIIVSSEVREQLGFVDESSESPQAYGNATISLLQEIDRSFAYSKITSNQRHKSLKTIGTAALSFLGVMLPGTILTMWLSSGINVRTAGASMILGTVVLLVSLLLSIGAVVWAFRNPIRRIEALYAQRLSKLLEEHYRDKGRAMVSRMLAATHLSFHDLLQVAFQCIHQQELAFGVSRVVPQYMRQDVGLWIYATAVRFQR
ncbi:MAG: hypothetical protein LW870_08085 [Pirellula sp.]|nr:hypothetical protein [Pirellula sp.]